MVRHRCRPTRALSAAAAFAAAFLLSTLAAAPAAAQSVQVFVNTAWVQNTNVNCGITAFVPPQARCTISSTPNPQSGNISNNPQIQFESEKDDVGADRCNLLSGGGSLTNTDNPNIFGTKADNVCNDSVYMCAQIGVVNPSGGTVAVDEVEFEIFRFIDGSNPLDATSTPPLKTFFIDNAGQTSAATDTLPDGNDGYCVLWDGSQPLQGGTGKINGTYGFRVTVQTNEQGQSGNIVITQTRAYPSGFTYDSLSNAVSQQPITVDVTNVHVVRSTPTVVGQITGVSAEPYNFTYRLSKDATMYLSVLSSLSPFNTVRNVIPGLPRTGEGALTTTNSTPLLNGDSWDGRDNNGNVLSPGNYLAVFQANASDQYGPDLSFATTAQIALDPLQITDIRVQPLLGGSTSLAVLSYMLTEPATVYMDVYPPGTQFCNEPGGVPALSDVNNPNLDGPVGGLSTGKFFYAAAGACNGGTIAPLRTVVQQQAARASVISFWDGRDSSGNLMGDGDYVFVIYAALPSQDGQNYNGNAADKRVWTSVAKSGFISVLRGLVGVTQVTPTSSVIGSSPAVAGLNPFSFRYQLARDAVVSLKVFNSSGTQVVKTLVNQETRPGLFNNVETWSDGTDDNGLVVASGTYLVQLTAYDPAFPAKVSTTTALFPVDLFRITDVGVTPLLSGASDQVTLTYQLSQSMFVAWNIYPAGSVVANSTAAWPPCAAQSPPNACTSASVLTPQGQPANPVVTFHGLRPGRLKISEFWDGRDSNGLFVPDGSYVYTLTAQSTTTPQYFASDRVFGSMTVARGAIVFLTFNVTPDVPQLFNSSNTITLDPFTISYVLSRQSSVTVQIMNTAIPPQVVRNLVVGSVRQNGILQQDVWDGRDDRGNFPPAGFYLVRAVAQDVASVLTSGSTAQQTISFDPLRIYDLAIAPLRGDSGGATLFYQVSEPMTVSIKIYKPKTTFDSSGNPSPPDNISLVRRIVGVRPARTAIQDTWDGLDYRLSRVPDGTYKFKIVGSTDPSAIDPVTGDVLDPSELAEDRLVDDIPVAVNGSLDPQADFEGNTFVYPNPVTGPSGVFCIYNPFHGRVLLKLYTLSGELVLSKDFGDRPAAFQVTPSQADSNCTGGVSYVWNKVNASGRAIARGLYYAVIRAEETEGGATVLQTVKKVLVP